MSNFYIADTHFGHRNCVRFDDRPFRSIEEHDETLISNWNSVVQPRDDVFILGDFAYKLNYRQMGEYVDSWMSFTIGDVSCTVPSQYNSGGYNEQVLYCHDGIRCYNELNGTYVNVNDILQAMGFNKTIGISSELGGAEAVWYFADLEAVTQ
ncbi:MAG: hypothetical protein IJG63_05785 [Oscillospiraceae bacterium]|nr:hypothetical protein [Oscillospiraceae bacterium]